MAKSLLHNQALSLRRTGKSLDQIANELKISKDTASRWTRDVILSVKQLEKLQKRSLLGAERGRLTANLNRRNNRINRINNEKSDGIEYLKFLTKRELLVAGLAFYSGEGVKARREVRFCNSDPKIILFMLRWLKECFNIKVNDLHCAVGINIVHKKRESEVINYWSKITTIPIINFRNTSFKKVVSRKTYENFNDHYGTLDVRVLKSVKYFDRIMGLIYGLLENKLLE